MSTFADTHLPSMTVAQMTQYDLFLDENDWDIYYWATQEPTPTSLEAAEGAVNTGKNLGPTDPGKQTGPEAESDEYKQGSAVEPAKGEWAQTVGTFKPAYRPVPARWRNSEILASLRRHVIDRSAGGVHQEKAGIEEEGLNQRSAGSGGRGKLFDYQYSDEANDA
jgi:hypothetical protein